MTTGLTERHTIALEVLKSTHSISKLVSEQDLQPDDLKTIIARLQQVIILKEAEQDLHVVKQTLLNLQALKMPLPNELKVKAQQLAELFPDDEVLNNYQARSKTKRDTVKGVYVIGKAKFNGSRAGAFSQEIKDAVARYNQENGTKFEPKHLRYPESKRDDFKFIPSR